MKSLESRFCWRNHIPKRVEYLQFSIATGELNVLHQVYSNFDLRILLMIKTIYFCLAHLEHLLVNFDCLYEEAGVNNNNCSKPQPSWIQHPWGWTNMVICLSTSPGKITSTLNIAHRNFCLLVCTCLNWSDDFQCSFSDQTKTWMWNCWRPLLLCSTRAPKLVGIGHDTSLALWAINIMTWVACHHP